MATFVFVWSLMGTILAFGLAESRPVIEAQPKQIRLGLTSTLDVNCSLPAASRTDMVSLISLLLSHSSDLDQSFTDMASLTSFTPHTVNLLTTESLQENGIIDQAGESYIHLRWINPTTRHGGLYQCKAQGIDLVGRNIVMISTTEVTVGESTLDDFAEKLQKVEDHIKTLGQTVSRLTNRTNNLEKKAEERDNHTSNLEKTVSEMSNLMKSLDDRLVILEQINLCSPQFIQIPVTYQSSKYYLRKDGTYDVQASVHECKKCGGDLIVIDNQDEFNIIQGYLNTTTGFRWVVIAGSDQIEEGKWVVQSTNTTVPYFNWQTIVASEPDGGTGSNCLLLWSGEQWKMQDEPCHWTSVRSDIRYICEIKTT